MSNASPPEGPSSKGKIRDLDEAIGVLVAFLTIGSILFWGLGNRKSEVAFKGWQNLFANTSTSNNNNLDSSVGFSGDVESTQAILGYNKQGKIQSNLAEAQSSIRQPRVDTSTSFPVFFRLPNGQTTNNNSASNQANNTPVTTETTTTTPTPTPTSTPTTPAVNSQLKDLPADYWARPFIEGLQQKGLIFGATDSSYQPEQPLTRAELASQISKVFEQQAKTNSIKFSDVATDNQLSPSIDESVKSGFMKGYPGQVFEPNKNVSRLEVLVALVSGLNIKPTKDPNETLKQFQDADKIPKWAIPKIAAATESGLVVNHPNLAQLNSERPATRADLAATIYQSLVYSGKVPKVSSQYLVPAN